MADASNTQATRRVAQPGNSGTQPLGAQPLFARRPPDAIFGDSFILDSLIFSDEHQHRYSIHQLDVPEDLQIRVCSNPDCGAVFPPRSATPEKFCTDCGQKLERGGKDLVLIEAQAPVPEQIVRAAAKGLSHGSVRSPLATFVERLAGQPRHCVVVARIAPLEGQPEPLTAIRWGTRLARGLEYLHDNGVTFDGQVDVSSIGLSNGQAVWANFTTCRHHPEGYVTERQTDTQALAKLVFSWLSEKSSYESDPNLSPALQHALDQTLKQNSIANGLELAEAFEKAVEEMSIPQAVDFQVGRASNVGKVRSLNEDSLLCLELNRIQQSVSRPLGVFVVADGMGGHSAGEAASSAIIDTIARKALEELLMGQLSKGGLPPIREWLRKAVEVANAEVYRLRKAAGNDMGSTLVAVLVNGNQAVVAHVGDSRVYRINQLEVQRLTVDHSLVERLISNKQITREEARYHPQRNVIYRTIGDKSTVEVELSEHALSLGDCLVLCSDGLVGPLDDATIAKTVREAPSPQDACNELIRLANLGGGDDNISAIVVKMIQPC